MSDARGSAGGEAPSRLAASGLGVTAAIALACALAVASVRASLFQANARVKETSDVYVLPPPEQVVTLSLGYRSALADLLWAHVLVSQGLHTIERRRFENLTLLLDAVNELDPTFREPYLLADALITFQNETPREEVLKARAIMELGVKNRPLDGELWLVLGQFVAFIAPGTYLTDPEEQNRWRLEGAQMLARAAELGGDNSNIGWQAFGGAGILQRAGQIEASISFLRRTIAVTEDPELREKAEKQLAWMLAKKSAEIDQLADAKKWQTDRRRYEAFQETWRRDLPFVTKSTLLLLGPPRDAAWCAGTERALSPGCAATWKDWSDRLAR